MFRLLASGTIEAQSLLDSLLRTPHIATLSLLGSYVLGRLLVVSIGCGSGSMLSQGSLGGRSSCLKTLQAAYLPALPVQRGSVARFRRRHPKTWPLWAPPAHR